MSHVASDYICAYCGNVCVAFDNGSGREKKYTVKDVYCPICLTDTKHIRLGDKCVVKAELESMDVLEGMDYVVYSLLTTNYSRKEKQFIK